MQENSPAARYLPGTLVLAEGLPGILEVVDGPDKKGNYELRLGASGMVLRVHQSKIIRPLSDKEKRRKTKGIVRRGHAPSPTPEPRLDLHGLTAAQALEMLETAIDRALLANLTQLEVVHGLGTGTLKHAVHQYLAGSKHVSRFWLDPLNPGTTWVEL